MKRLTYRTLVRIFVLGIILSPFLYQLIVIRPRIYYTIEYDINLSNREEIVYKVENLNYPAYLNNFENPDYPEIQSYVDRDFITFLKSRIDNDNGFHLSLYYAHYLLYSFLGKNYSKLYLTYSNNRIFSLLDQNNQSLIVKGDFYWYDPGWYLNFALVPYVYGNISTVVLNDSIFIMINAKYVWACGYVCLHEYRYKQYLVLNKNLDIILIFIYNDIFID